MRSEPILYNFTLFVFFFAEKRKVYGVGLYSRARPSRLDVVSWAMYLTGMMIRSGHCSINDDDAWTLIDLEGGFTYAHLMQCIETLVFCRYRDHMGWQIERAFPDPAPKVSNEMM